MTVTHSDDLDRGGDLDSASWRMAPAVKNRPCDPAAWRWRLTLTYGCVYELDARRMTLSVNAWRQTFGHDFACVYIYLYI
jgi:hypothetical protein